MNPHGIKEFVRDTLGCTCPEEVFLHMEYLPDSRPDVKQMTIGNRLLIIIWKTSDTHQITEHLFDMISDSIKQRDQRGLNRVRMVIAVKDVDTISDIAESIFQGHPGKDEKTHVHVVHQREVESL